MAKQVPRLCPRCKKQMTFIPAREKCSICISTHSSGTSYWVCLDCNEIIEIKK